MHLAQEVISMTKQELSGDAEVVNYTNFRKHILSKIDQ
jgi:hypothetical protein